MTRFIFIILLIVLSNLIAEQSELRMAIDFGSGAVKMQLGIVDIEENRLIGQPLLAKHVSLNLTEDMAAHGGRISEDMEIQGLTILNQLKEEAHAVAAHAGHSSLKIAGIATAAFRKAQNGTELLQKFEQQLGIRFQILSQEEEGKLGFMTAKALFPQTPENQLIAWDNGNGSFQMTGREGEQFTVYQGPIGYGTVLVLLSKEIRNGPMIQPQESGNPVLRKEADALVQKIHERLSAVPAWLKEKLGSGKTIIATFGDGHSLFPVLSQSKVAAEGIQELVQEATVTRQDLADMCDTYLEQSDELFNVKGVHRRTYTAALYVLTVMDHLGIQALHYKRSIGNTTGILISPQFWSSGYASSKGF